jgi:8-oxo-dGTP pyrophosphatase MutT (NUDIX family)
MKTCNLDSFHIGAKAIIFNNEDKVLLLERDHPVKKLYWDLPGGRVQKDESINETLLRELKEEVGLETSSIFHPFGMFLTNIRIPIEGGSIGLIFSIFKCHLANKFHPVLSQEHINFEWLTPLQAADKLKTYYPSEFIEQLARCK